MKIIFAQGNPEPDYKNTRHNTGFAILNELANKFNSKWTDNSKFNAITCEIMIDGEKILLVKPKSYYNETGRVIQSLIAFYKLVLDRELLVIHDDLALPFGAIRVREKGSDGGNNGIKSINSHLGPDYPRIRIGIYNELRDKMNDDAKFVLSKFNHDENEQLIKKITPKVIELIEQFCAEKLEMTSYKQI